VAKRGWLIEGRGEVDDPARERLAKLMELLGRTEIFLTSTKNYQSEKEMAAIKTQT
jgi:hypothetical protein